MVNSNEIQGALEQGLRCHGEGKLQQAEQIYRHIIGIDPRQTDALHYLGVIALQAGQFDAAAELIGKAVEVRPDYVDALTNLGNALQALGRPGEAVERYQQALAIQPGVAAVLANLGNALLQSGRPHNAIESYRAALLIDPQLAQVRRGLADALLLEGRPGDALHHIEQAIEQQPEALEMKVSKGNILQELGRDDEAIACFKFVLDVRPDIAPVYCNVGNVLRQSGRLAEAVEYYEKALQLDPNYVEGHRDLGIAYQDLGEKEKALDAFRRAIALDSHSAKAWRAIAFQSGNDLTDDEIQAMHALSGAPACSSEQQMHVEFALGKVYEDKRQYADAIGHYHSANRLHRDASDYSVENDRLVFDNLKAVFSAGFFERWSAIGLADATPIFIVGMPRSGTTLVEQILASHPLVYGGGELMLLPRAIAAKFEMQDGVDYTEALREACRADLESVASHYIATIRERDDDTQHITDKLPSNFLNLGLINILFPKARVIHCVRDARDTCFSIYKHIFNARGHHYGYDLKDLAHYYNLYADLMGHWERVIPNAFYDFPYESVVAEQELTTRALLEYCGLPWDPACLEFHKTRRPVATISASQVRQPIYTGSVGSWRNYEDSLAPLVEILDQSVNSETSR